MPGVKIGDGAIIGAYSVVAKDVPPYTVAVGNPVQLKRKRFDDEMIELLEELAWWNWDVEEVTEFLPYLTSPDIEMVRGEIKRRLGR